GRVAPGAPRSQPVSIPTHLTAAMRAAVEIILAEGLRHRFARHAVAAAALRAGLDAMRLELFPDPAIASNTVTCVRTPHGIDARAVVTTMRDRHGILVGTGLDTLRTGTLRIGTMSLTASPAYILPTLAAPAPAHAWPSTPAPTPSPPPACSHAVPRPAWPRPGPPAPTTPTSTPPDATG